MKLNKSILFLFSICLIGCGLNGSPGEGKKIGQIVRVHHGGIFFDTWEAELIRGGISNGSGTTSGSAFHFTANDAQAAQLQAFMDKQTEVVITYREKGIYSVCTSDSRGNFLLDVRASNTAQ